MSINPGPTHQSPESLSGREKGQERAGWKYVGAPQDTSTYLFPQGLKHLQTQDCMVAENDLWFSVQLATPA